MIAGTGAGALAANPAVPLLNHFYATVDAQTYAAIAASRFLREQFAPFEKRTTVRNDSTYTGLYFYGTQTYFEFFEENQGDRKPGDAGLALGVEKAGGSEALRRAWEGLRPSVTTMVTRQLAGAPVDWFKMTSFEETRAQSAVEGLRLFAMEYAPGFVRKWSPSSPDSIEMRAVLAAYCERLKLTRMRESSLLDNARRIVIGGPEAGIRLRAAQLKAAGWKVQTARNRVLCQGPNVTVIFEYSPTPEGVKEVEFTLKGTAMPAVHEIGRTRLEVSSARRALWRLRS